MAQKHSIINLDEVPKQGKEYFFSNKDSALNDSLKDLISTDTYSINITITPETNFFRATGLAKFSVEETCSKCGWELPLSVDCKVNEILFIKDGTEERHKNNTSNQIFMDVEYNGPETTYLETSRLDLGAFVRQQIGLAIPQYPNCSKASCPNLEFAQKKIEIDRKKWEAVNDESSPFSVLSKIKKN